MKTIKDVKVGDIVLCYDEYSRDADIHEFKVQSIENDAEEGIILYGKDLTFPEVECEDYVGRVTANAFIKIKEEKQTYATTSNQNLNVPMTETQWDIVDFIAFESETSIIYPFKIKFDDLTMENINEIIKNCTDVEDTDAIYEACEKVLGAVKR